MAIYTLGGPVATSQYTGKRILLGSSAVADVLEIVAGPSGASVYQGQWGEGTVVANVGRTLYSRLRLEGSAKPLKKLWNLSVWLTEDQLLLLNALFLAQQDLHKNSGSNNSVTLQDYWFPAQERLGSTGDLTFLGSTATRFGTVVGDCTYSVLLSQPNYSGVPVGYDKFLVEFQAVQY